MSKYVLTPAAAAEILLVSPDTVRRWADCGLLVSHRLPSGHRRIEPASVFALQKKLRDREPAEVTR